MSHFTVVNSDSTTPAGETSLPDCATSAIPFTTAVLTTMETTTTLNKQLSAGKSEKF